MIGDEKAAKFASLYSWVCETMEGIGVERKVIDDLLDLAISSAVLHNEAVPGKPTVGREMGREKQNVYDVENTG